MNQLNKTKQFWKTEKERDLWYRYKDEPSDENRNNLIIYYEPILRKNAWKYYETKMKGTYQNILGFDDYWNEVNMMLIKHLHKFDTNKGYTFLTFIMFRMRGVLADALRELDFVPRLVRKRKEEVPDILSLDITINEHSNNKVLKLKDTIFYINKEQNNLSDFIELIRNKGLNSIEKLILYLYFVEDKSMKEIGKNLKLSESRISQKMSNILSRLKARGRQSFVER